MGVNPPAWTQKTLGALAIAPPGISLDALCTHPHPSASLTPSPLEGEGNIRLMAARPILLLVPVAGEDARSTGILAVMGSS